jgi:hypothetical protein
MQKLEAIEFIRHEMMPLWTEWGEFTKDSQGQSVRKIPDVVINFWCEQLIPFTRDIALNAVRRTKLESRGKEPNAKILKGFAYELKTKTEEGEQKNKGIVDPCVFVICVDKDDAGRGCIGKMEAVHVPPLNIQHPLDTLLRAAEKTKEKLSYSYGGIWRVYQIDLAELEHRNNEMKDKYFNSNQQWHESYRLTTYNIAKEIAREAKQSENS